jgi:hypothetical protein
MTNSKETETIQDDSNHLISLLTSEARTQFGIDSYFHDVKESMKEEASVIDPKKARAALVLLVRNLVLATSNVNGGTRAIDKMTDVYKEVFSFGEKFAGVNLDATASAGESLSIHDKLENLQIALEADDRVENPEIVLPEATIGLTESLVFANINLLSTPDNEGITNHTSLRYYVDNFVTANRIMAKGDA